MNYQLNQAIQNLQKHGYYATASDVTGYIDVADPDYFTTGKSTKLANKHSIRIHYSDALGFIVAHH